MFPVPTLYVSSRVPYSIDLLQQLQDHEEFSTLRVVHIHNVRLESGTFRAYDSDNRTINLPPGMTGIPSYLSVSSNMARIISGGPDILAHFGISSASASASASASTEVKPAKYISSESDLAPKAFLSSQQKQQSHQQPQPPYVNNITVPQLAPPIHVPSENEKKVAMNASLLEEYNRKSQANPMQSF